MSLIEYALENCVMMDKRTVSDGEGGFSTGYVDGAEIRCAITYDTSVQMRIAGASAKVSAYTITTKRNAELQYHDVIKRLRDGKIFRVTSASNDKQTPTVASFEFSQVTAEEWSI